MKLSIITINYNNRDGLRRTIDSVLVQTWRDFEWIIIDGGSTDGSKELIEEVAAKSNSNISFWCSEKDKGIYNAMNKGIFHTTGEYCLFLNSGDWLYEITTLESIAPKLVIYDIIYGKVYKNKQNKDELCFRQLCKDYLSGYDLLVYTLPHQASFIKTELFQRYGGYDENYKIFSDWKFFVNSILFNGATYKYENVPISYQQQGGISGNPSILGERKRISDSLFSPLLLDDIILAESARKIRGVTLFRLLYSALYRMSLFLK